MNCGDIQAKLIDLAQGTLAPAELEQAEGHLQHCSACNTQRSVLASLLAPPTEGDVPELAKLPAMLERARGRILAEFNDRGTHARLQGFAAFRRSAINQLKVSLAAASDEDLGSPLIGRLDVGPDYYVVYFTRERNELHLDFIDKKSKRPTKSLDGAVVCLNGGQASTTIADGAAHLPLADLIDASEMTIKLPSGAEIRVS